MFFSKPEYAVFTLTKYLVDLVSHNVGIVLSHVSTRIVSLTYIDYVKYTYCNRLHTTL